MLKMNKTDAMILRYFVDVLSEANTGFTLDNIFKQKRFKNKAPKKIEKDIGLPFTFKKDDYKVIANADPVDDIIMVGGQPNNYFFASGESGRNLGKKFIFLGTPEHIVKLFPVKQDADAGHIKVNDKTGKIKLNTKEKESAFMYFYLAAVQTGGGALPTLDFFKNMNLKQLRGDYTPPVRMLKIIESMDINIRRLYFNQAKTLLKRVKIKSNGFIIRPNADYIIFKAFYHARNNDERADASFAKDKWNPADVFISTNGYDPTTSLKDYDTLESLNTQLEVLSKYGLFYSVSLKTPMGKNYLDRVNYTIPKNSLGNQNKELLHSIKVDFADLISKKTSNISIYTTKTNNKEKEKVKEYHIRTFYSPTGGNTRFEVSGSGREGSGSQQGKINFEFLLKKIFKVKNIDQNKWKKEYYNKDGKPNASEIRKVSAKLKAVRALSRDKNIELINAALAAKQLLISKKIEPHQVEHKNDFITSLAQFLEFVNAIKNVKAFFARTKKALDAAMSKSKESAPHLKLEHNKLFYYKALL